MAKVQHMFIHFFLSYCFSVAVSQLFRGANNLFRAKSSKFVIYSIYKKSFAYQCHTTDEDHGYHSRLKVFVFD